MDFKTLLVLACVAASCIAGPVREKYCATQCNSRDDEGMFRSFKSYYFDYEVTIDSRIDGGASDQTSRVQVQATAAIEGLSACEMVLKLSEVSITEKRQDGTMVAPADASFFASSLESHPLRFAMESNGTVTSVCPEAGEETWVLNVKRGFLSIIQTKITRRNEVLGQAGIFETDVTGTCMPMYQSEGDTITKTQDYTMCKDRTSLNMFTDAVPVHTLAPTMSPMTSHLVCEYQMDAQGLTSATCTENHTLKPFAQSDSQPLTSVVSTVQRRSVTHRITSSLLSDFARQTTLLYEDSHAHSMVDSGDVLDTLTAICASMSDGVGSETPGLFESLTEQLGKINQNDMTTIMSRMFRQCSASSAAIKKDMINMVKDALIDCETEECASGFNSIMNSENSADNDIYRKKWLMKQIFHNNPSKSMIDIAKRYAADDSSVKDVAYYALPSMIQRYCLLSEDDCSQDADIIAAASIFEDNLHDSCQPETDEEEKKMVLSLRAIGNMGLIRSKTLLNRCVSRDRNSYRLRIAGIEAFRRAPCENVPTERFMRIFSTVDTDSEMRIAAYRAMIRCPSEELLEGIANAIATEPTHQVTCYVSSHLANLRESKNPLLSDAQDMLSASSLSNITQCHMDIRKFSRNYAFSRYHSESGNGIHVDSDLVFSSNSYLPRNFRLGMDVDLFGYDLDLFEFGARMEGVQELFESLIGLDEDDRESNMVERVKRLMNFRAARQKREGVKSSSLNRIKTKYLQNHVIPENSEEAALSLKIMDREIFYQDQDDFRAFADKFSRENMMMMVAQLMQMRSHSYTLNKNFKQSHATLPTLAGMPLKVSIQGAMTLSVKASGKLDVMGMAMAPRNMAVVGSLEPSAAVEVHSSLMVDAHCARSGLTHKTNMASSLSFGGSITVENGMLKVRVDAPEKRQTLIDASSSLFFMQNDELVQVAEAADSIVSIDETFANPQYSLHISGQRPTTAIPLLHSFHMTFIKIYLDKIDPTLMNYDLEIGHRTDKAFVNGAVQKTERFHMLVGAPGSQTIGTYSVDLDYHHSNKTLNIHTLEPSSDMYITGVLRDDLNNKNLRLQATYNGKDYAVQAGLDTVALAAGGVKYVPVFEVKYEDVETYSLAGHVTKADTVKSMDLSIINKNQQKLMSFTGELVKNTTHRYLSFSEIIGSYSSSFTAGYQIQEATGSRSITPIFSMATSIPALPSLRLGGTPAVITDSGVTMAEVYLTTTTARLIEMTNLHLQKTAPISFGFQGKIRETIPYGVEFDLTETRSNSKVVHTADLTATTIFGVYNVQGSLTNQSSDFLYGLEIDTNVNDTQYFSVSVDFKNEVDALQYMDTSVSYRGSQVFRSKNGLRQKSLSSKTRYTPLFILQTATLGRLGLSGTVDVSADGVTINDMALNGNKELVSLSGSAGVDRDESRVDWSFTVGGAYVTQTIAGSASHRDNTVTFNNVIMVSDGSTSPPSYTLTIDMQNSTTEGQIFAWDAMIKHEVSHHPELSFRFDTQYDLSAGRSAGNLIRLCYDGVDCTADDNKVITLGHALTFDLDTEQGIYSHNLEATYTHPAQSKDYTLTFTTGCYRDVSYSSALSVQDGSEVIFDTSYVQTPESATKNGSIVIEFEIPGVYSYGSRDVFSFSDPRQLYWLSEYRSGEQSMSYELSLKVSGDGIPHTSDFYMKYTDIRNDAYTLEYYRHMAGSGTTLELTTIKKNGAIKMFQHNQQTTVVSDSRVRVSTVYVAKTFFEPRQEISFNSTADVDLANDNDAQVQLQLRFMPDQKPIVLSANFNNKTTAAKKEGQLTTTLSLPTMSIAVFAGGKFENGVPTGNLSIKFLPLMGESKAFGVDLVVTNKSSADKHNYDTYVVLSAPEHTTTIKHTAEVNKASIVPLSSTLTGYWSDSESSVGVTVAPLGDGYETKFLLNIPGYEYVVSQVRNSTGYEQSITKNSVPLTIQRAVFVTTESGNDFSHTYSGYYNLMGSVYEMSLGVSKVSDSYSTSVQLLENSREALFVSTSTDVHQGRNHFDVAMVTRSAYLPNYNTAFELSFQKTDDGSVDLSSIFNVNDVELYSFTFTNGSSPENPNARVTRLIFKQPGIPDLRLRQFVIQDSCSMMGGITHNLTVMWGDLLPTQIMALRLSGARNSTAYTGAVQFLNPGRVMGFGTHFTASATNMRSGFNRNGQFSVSGESGNIISLETDYKNASQGYTKDHLVKFTMTRANKEPISILSTLVFNSTRAILDADLAVTYNQAADRKLTAGMEIGRLTAGHTATFTLQHLVNGIDITVMSSYSNTSSEFEMSLENSFMIGSEHFQPQISCILNRDTKEFEITYTGTGTYGFYGRFLNRTSEAGRIYEINCRNTYNNRVIPYNMLFDQPRRIVSMRVEYNPDNQDDFWGFNAGYWNDSSLYAELDTRHSDQMISNASVVLSWSADPKMAASHIKWEPAWPEDLKAAILDMCTKIKAMRQTHMTSAGTRLTSLVDKVNRTKNDFLLANMDILTSALLLKTQVTSSWALTEPLRQAQINYLKSLGATFEQKLQTLQTNLERIGADFDTKNALYNAQYTDIATHFASVFPLYIEDVERSWALFVEAGELVPAGFDGDAIAEHLQASNQAKNDFYENLFTQLGQDLSSMNLDTDLFKNHFRVIGENMRANAARIAQEIRTRIAVLESEVNMANATLQAIRSDGQALRQMFRDSVRQLKENAQTELEAFRHPDFSKFVEMGQDMNDTARMAIAQALGQLVGFSGQLMMPYAHLQTRRRRAAAAPPVDQVDLSAIKYALAAFDNKYYTPQINTGAIQIEIPEVVADPEPVAEVREPDYPAWREQILDSLKKIVTLETFDLVNGEIFVKVMLKDDYGNYTSFANRSKEYLLSLMPESFNTTKLEKLVESFKSAGLFNNTDLFSDFQQRYQLKFTTNSTYYEEIMRNISADLKTNLQVALETKIKPYIRDEVRPEVESRVNAYVERVQQEMESRSRPFFGSEMTIPEFPDHGEFFDDLADALDVEGVKRMIGKAKQSMCGVVNKVTSAVSMVKRAMCPKTWVPPYKANALIVGAKHFMTFDQQFYDFSGKCGYLLAKDFVHENDFSAIVDYERDMEIPIRNMMFMINSTTFEIKSDGSVLVNRQYRELPFQVDDTVVLRIGDSIWLKNSHGVSYVCKLPHDVCIMTLSGRYFARTGGLLGNFNFEPYDDLKTPDNQVQTNVTAFADSWKVGKNCDGSINRVTPSTTGLNFDPLHPDNEQCATMFLDNCSPLARCHSGVDPDEFYRMCVTDTASLSETDRQAKMCSIASAYKTQCYMAGYKMNLPDSCITCALGDQDSFDASEPRKIEKSEVPRKVDVVIVVEEKTCAQSVAPNLDGLVARLAGELKDNGFNDTRFGLAAFGGSGVHDAPHEHTINHRIFNNETREFVLGRDSLEFSDDGNNDTFRALRLAANYPFRAGVAKHIILLSCSDCSKDDTKMRYSDLSIMLNKRGISLTMLTNFQFNLKKTSKDKSKVFGIDANSVYTSKMAGQEGVKGDRGLREFVNEPYNSCTLLAQETNGAIFDSGMLGTKAFDEVFVKRVVMTSEPAPCQICTCVQDRMVGVGRSVCEQCVDPTNPLQYDIRGGIRDIELEFNLPHYRFQSQDLEEEQ